MTQLLVSLYRIAIGVVFIAGVFILMAAFSNLGVLLTALGLLFLVLAVGVSAVLLSINDHLASLRTSPEPSVSDTEKLVVASVLALAACAALFFTAASSSKQTGTRVTAAPSSSVDRLDGRTAEELVAEAMVATDTGETAPTDLDENGCSPSMAASVGLKCE